MAFRRKTHKGFTQTGRFLTGQIKSASQGRGFAETKVLTHWAEIVGPELAAISRPVKVSYGRSGLGATLTVLTTGAQAPMLEMQKTKMRDMVNGVYGYSAISNVRITQTAATGFAEGQADFAHKPVHSSKPAAPRPAAATKAKETVDDVQDEGLRDALARLGAHIIDKDNKGKNL